MTQMHGDGGEERLAPITPLFGDRVVRASELAREPEGGPVDRTPAPEHPVVEPDDGAQRAEEALVRKLRARSLSVSEARQVLRRQELASTDIEDVIDRFCERGYLDDALLAEHLVLSGVERKGQGRVALSRALAQRGIPRDVIDTALGDLPDDDAERALEFARSKARSLSRLDFETALRRLMGQLARRGYGGAVAANAARTALTEPSPGGLGPGVRFVDSD
ncbi:regulatory protein RecX [Microbacterium sp.]|uniref:regulatory protein RecX n=1 Tax=Microbacterium sp. TaxID=51671 RepID=UPI003F9C9AE5